MDKNLCAVLVSKPLFVRLFINSVKIFFLWFVLTRKYTLTHPARKKNGKAGLQTQLLDPGPANPVTVSWIREYRNSVVGGRIHKR